MRTLVLTNHNPDTGTGADPEPDPEMPEAEFKSTEESEEHVAGSREFSCSQTEGRIYGSPLCFSSSILIIFKLCKISRCSLC